MYTPRAAEARRHGQPPSVPRGGGVSLVLLGLPTLGLSLAITTVAALVPLLLRPLTESTTVIGSVIAMEGLLALVLPLWLGWLSDRTRTRFGRRLPYVLLGAPLCGISLSVLPFARSLSEITAAVVVFYLGYFVIYPPYRALYLELVPRADLGRSQGIQTVLREIGLALGLGICPVLFTLWKPLPFHFCAFVIVSLSVLFVFRLDRALRVEARSRQPLSARELGLSITALFRARPDIPRVLLANSLWEFALAGLKTFVLLYIVVAQRRTPASASGLMALVAVVTIFAAPVAGYLADRFGIVRVMRGALVVYALGLLTPALTSSVPVLIALVPVIGFGGAIAMTLPYAVLAERLPPQCHGLGAGLYEFSRGVGALSGPIATGAAIDLARPIFVSTQGYGALWLVVSAALLVSIPLVPAKRPK
ncbi:MAG TPA: MFS transporter [Polyangiaceae bacterium]